MLSTTLASQGSFLLPAFRLGCTVLLFSSSESVRFDEEICPDVVFMAFKGEEPQSVARIPVKFTLRKLNGTLKSHLMSCSIKPHSDHGFLADISGDEFMTSGIEVAIRDISSQRKCWRTIIPKTVILGKGEAVSDGYANPSSSCSIGRSGMRELKISIFNNSFAQFLLPCRPGQAIPNPFRKQAFFGFYDEEGLFGRGHSPVNFHILEIVWRPLAMLMQEFLANCDDINAFIRLLSHGLLVTPFGMDFSNVFHSRYRGSLHGEDFNFDEDVRRIRRAFFGTRIHDLIFWRVDVPTWYRSIQPSPPSVLLASVQPLLESFWRDGYVRVHQWGGLDVSQLRHALVVRRNLTRVDRLLTPLLAEGSLLRTLVSGYLGEDVRFNGWEHLTVKGPVTRVTYDNGAFHHDGCGTRLKAFVYIHDVTSSTHPTLIASGTHRTQWYPTTHYFAGVQGHNKLNPNLVMETYGSAVKQMLGRAGGGFVFDTNALHGAEIDGTHQQRDVVILDFGAAKHLDSLESVRSRDARDSYLSAIPDGWCLGQGFGKSFSFSSP